MTIEHENIQNTLLQTSRANLIGMYSTGVLTLRARGCFAARRICCKCWSNCASTICARAPSLCNKMTSSKCDKHQTSGIFSLKTLTSSLLTSCHSCLLSLSASWKVACKGALLDSEVSSRMTSLMVLSSSSRNISRYRTIASKILHRNLRFELILVSAEVCFAIFMGVDNTYVYVQMY